MQEEDIFIVALDKADKADRAAYLNQACGDDAALRARIDALLQSHEGAGSFLAPPVRSAKETGEFHGKGAQASNAEAVGNCIGPYKLLQQIGEGGMGVVWMAEQQEPVRRKVALKVIKAGMDSAQVVARFEAERQALALMDHPNIAKVLDAGATSNGRPYIVMELVKGMSITKYCDDHQLTPRQRLELFVPVCQAIQHAHQKGIIHRDLKPSNVFVASYDGKPIPKVIDFGVAKAMGQQLTERTLFTGFGGIVGTLEYMSPEQAEFNALDIDTRSDVYSLGVLLYELLTGTTPLTRQRLKESALTEVLRLIREEEPPRPSTRLSESRESIATIAAQRRLEPMRLTRELRGELDWIVMKALEKDRGRRYDTATGLARDIERYLADENVEACPPSVRYRMQKFVRKHRSLLGTAATFAALLVIGTVVSLLLTVRAVNAETDALKAWDAEINARLDVEKQRDRATNAETDALKARDAEKNARIDVEKQRDRATNAETDALKAWDAEKNARIDIEKQRDRAQKAENLAKERLVEVTAQKKRADQEAAIARAVNDFIQHDLLEQADVGHQADETGRDPDVKVRTLLDRAAKAIDRKFAKQPFTEAAIRHTVGNAYLALGRFADAKPHIERSVELHVKHAGADNPNTLIARNSLAIMTRMEGKHERAEAMFKQLVADCESRLGADHPYTLVVKHHLARLFKTQGHYDRAEALCKEVLAARIDRLEPNHRDTLSSKQLLALLLQMRGKFDEAEKIYKDTQQALVAEFGANHPKVLNLRADLAGLSKSRGNYAEAESRQQEVLKSYTAILGADHPTTLSAKNNLAQMWSAQRKYDRAETLLKETLQAQKTALGENHLDTLTTKSNLATVYQGQKKYADAEALFQETLDASNAHLGVEHINTLLYKNNLAGLYFTQGKFDRAEPLFREVFEKQKANLGMDHVKTLTTGNNLAGTYFSQRKYELAEPLFEEVLKLQRTRLSPSDQQTTINNLAGVYFMSGKFDKAEPLLREMLAHRKGKDAESDLTADAFSKLGQCLLKTEKFAEAESLLRDCHAIRIKKQPTAFNVFNVKSQIGAALLGQKKYADAEPLLVQGYEGMKKVEAKVPPSARIYVTEAVDRLVRLYDAWGQEDKAAQWRKVAEARKKSS